ncbi:hypothetical protein PV325_011591, partial [Microctonus aethiopoides]
PMGMEKLFRATPIYGSDSLFIQLKFLFLKTTIRPFVSEISSCECKRILFHSIPDIDATTGRTANQRAVPKSGENFLQGSAMLFWRLWDGSCFAHNALLDDAKLEITWLRAYCRRAARCAAVNIGPRAAFLARNPTSRRRFLIVDRKMFRSRRLHCCWLFGKFCTIMFAGIKGSRRA